MKAKRAAFLAAYRETGNVKLASVNYRAARADQKEQDDKDPTGHGRRQP